MSATRFVSLLASSILLLLLSAPAAVLGQYAQATISGIVRPSTTAAGGPQLRSNPECAFDLVATSNPTMFAIGGYNVTGGGATIPYPSYGTADLWYSANGFNTVSYKAPTATVNGTTSAEVGRISGGAAYLSNGVLLYFGGLLGEYSGSIVFSQSTYYSTDMGTTWNLAFTGNATYIAPVTRYEMAYTVVPNTNTVIIGGGTTYSNGLYNDVWMSTDGYGRVWTRQNAGGAANPNVTANAGGAMVALYDSPTTLVWVTPFFTYYKSTDLGMTWSQSFYAPWESSYYAFAPTYTRELPVLAVDHDNYIYYAGGDSGSVQPDMWLSTDKAVTWTQIAVVNNQQLVGGFYAAAIGSCMAVRTVNGAKELDLYGGSLYTYQRGVGYNSSNAYALQMTLSFAPTAYNQQPTPLPTVTSRRWYWYYSIAGNGFTVCASGYLYTPSTATINTIGSANPTYLVWWLTGTRVFSNSTYTMSQSIAGLAPIGQDGGSQYIYPNTAPYVDGGGLTYLLATTGLGETNNFVNVYSSGGVLQEDGFLGTEIPVVNLTLSANPIATKCLVYGSATLSTGLQGAPISLTGQTNTPQFRSNPECAMDLTATTNPTMFAIGGYNSTGGSTTIPMPSFAKSDIWSSTDGFQTALWNAGQTGYPRLAAAAGYLMNGNLVTWGGLAGEYSNTIVYDTSVTYSSNRGTNWNTSFTDAGWLTSPSVARYEMAYCAVPYTNTLVFAGGQSTQGTMNDVWISTDGRGANWTLQYNSTTGNRNPFRIPPHRGGAMVALYDSSLVSPQYVTPNSTLVLMLPSAQYYKSTDMGRTWTTAYTGPWRPSGVPAGTFSRYLVVVTADRDNYLYFGGGDAGTTSTDLWMSFDRAESWTQLALVNNIANVQYASAIGSCMGVNTVNGVKTLSIYGGNVWTRVVTNGVRAYTPTTYYALQFGLNFSLNAAPSSVTNVPNGLVPRTWYWSYGVTSTAGDICASGTVITPTSASVSTLTGTNAAYRVWFIQGARVFTNSTYAQSQIIAGLSPFGLDGNDATFYPQQTPPVSNGGLTFNLASTGLLDSQPYINIYNNGGVFAEDAETVSTTITQNLTISVSPIANSWCASRIVGQATIASGLAGAPITLGGQTNTPQYRSNPECAYDLQNIRNGNATFYAIGGFNVTFQTAAIPMPTYAQGDIWASTDGFTTTAATSWRAGQYGYPRESACSAYLPNGNIVVWGGLGSTHGNTLYYDISVTYSQDGGYTWNTSYTDPLWNSKPSASRYEAAYCAVPFTNTIVTAGGHVATSAGVSSDVWISTDGTGATWTQMNAGGSATTVQPFWGGVMVAMYDSQYVSFQYQTPNSTLVLVSNYPYYYKSYDLGATWTPAYNAPWDRSASSALYPTMERSLPVLVADMDNYVYYGGGDINAVAPDFWLSVDKAESFTRLNIVNTLSGAYYAAGIGACLGVRYVNGVKQLDLFGGNLYFRNSTNNAYTTTAYYSLQMNLAFGTSSTINTQRYPVAGAQPTTYYWSYAVQANGSNPFSICAQGSMVVSNSATLGTYGTSNPAYAVWWFTGVRIFTNASYSMSQIITGLGPISLDGSSNLLYTQAPYFDGGGLTYLLATTGLGDSNNFINLYNSSGTLYEDGFSGTQFTLTRPFTFSRVAPGPYAPGQCRLYATANIASATQGAPISLTSFTNTPQFRSNPECAYNLTSLNPTMFAIGGYNQTGGGTSIAYPSYAKGDIWYSTDGFQTATYSPGQAGYPRLAGNAAYLANGNLVTWGGLSGEYNGYAYFDTSVTYSPDMGTTWVTSFTDANWNTFPSATRYESAYCAVPFTNTIITAGGSVATSVGTANDVWMSTDGTGAIWVQTNPGGASTNVPLHTGSVMVAMYDSSAVSAQYPSSNSTLVLVLTQPFIFISLDYGYSWQQTAAPWGGAITAYPTANRALPVLTVDRDNYLYFAGGDTGVASPDFWLSVDKAVTWSRMGLTNSVAGNVYASAIGSCMAVRVVNGNKQLALYGGSILTLSTTTGNYSYTPVYALQINTQFVNSSAFNASAAVYPIAYARTTTMYFQYSLTSSAGYSICSSGTLTVSNVPTLATVNSAVKAYPVYWAQGVRVFSNSTYAFSQIITGLDYANTDGSTNLIYPSLKPPVDNGGLTFGLAGVGLGESYNFVNVYSNGGAGTGGTISEDGDIGTTSLVTNFTLSTFKGGLSCQVYGTANIASATTAAAISGNPTNTPQFRSNPECAYNLNQTSNQLMFAIGGYNSTGNGATVPYPSYARSDIWYTTNGFTASTFSPGQTNYARLAAAAGYLANGNLVTWGGLAGEYNGYTYFDTSVTYSQDNGLTWNTSYTDAGWLSTPSVARYEMAYCTIPYTNTLVLAGGVTAVGVLSDVWVSQDGIGALWQQMNPGGAFTRVPPHSGGVMAAFFDSNAVSSLYYAPNSTLLLILSTGVYYKSTSLGAYWSTPYPAPWQTFFSSYATFTRALPVLTIDHDNYAYYGGGDSGAPAADFWLSVDKAESWTRMGVVNSFASNALYAAAIGSCLSVQVVNGMKQLVLFGGNIYSTTTGSSTYTTQYYALQMNVAFTSAAPTAASLQTGLTASAPQLWYWKYSFTATSPAYSICASGQMVTPGTPTFASSGSSNPAYLVWWLAGTRVFTNSTTTVSQSIAGLAPVGDDGASNLLYTNSPFVDGGGITYLVASPPLGDANQFINLYMSSSSIAEDGEIGTVSGSPTIQVQKTPFTTGCPFYATSSITTGVAAATVPTTGPVMRLNPECAFDATNPNPTMFALGGSPDGGASASQDLFYSNDGFSASSQYIAAANGGGRYNGGAAYLANGNLLWWGGLVQNSNAATYWLTVWYSNSYGRGWNISQNTNGPWARQQFAYSVIPYTSTVVMIGGIPYGGTGGTANDVWISADGQGASWTRQDNGSIIQPFAGGQVAALFDSSYVSPAYVSEYSTLVLVVDRRVYTSYNLGANWLNAFNGSWGVSYPGSRGGLALATDRDNIIYLVGGDSYSADIWMSADKGYTWSQLGVNPNTFASGSGNFAAAIGACAAIRQVGPSKTLSVYGGDLYQWTGSAYTPLSSYSLQMPLTYSVAAPTIVQSTAPAGAAQYAYFKYTLTADTGSVCASGMMTISLQAKLGVFPAAYSIYAIQGVRVFTPLSGAPVTQTIAGMAPLGTDGDDHELYVAAPNVDGGGFTYLLANNAALYGPNNGPNGQAYVNVYNNSGAVSEDWTIGATGVTYSAPAASGPGFVWSTTVIYSCLSSSTAVAPTAPFRYSSSSSSSSSGAAAGGGGTTNASSGGSGLSGGAIAGIVIGSVVGALILIPLCLLAACRGRRGGNKATQLHDNTGSEQSQMQPSAVEMQESEHSVAPGEHHTETMEEEV